MKVTTHDIQNKKSKQKITVLTAYDYPTAKILDEEGIDIILVGDSLGMVVLGHSSTVHVTMDDMLHHGRAVSRGVQKSLVVCDMPFGSYENPKLAVENASRLVRQAKADAVKLEGGVSIQAQVKAILEAGISVMGHVGMLPQSVGDDQKFRVHGKDSKEADLIMADAQALDKLGVFAMVLECIPAGLAAKITQSVSCPTIGIGAGCETDGQVLVTHDALGFQSGVKPKFVRQYAALDQQIRKAVSTYREDVVRQKYPSKEESY